MCWLYNYSMNITHKVLEVVTQYHSLKQGAQAQKRKYALETYGTEPRFKPIYIRLNDLELLLEWQYGSNDRQEIHQAIAELNKTAKIQVDGSVSESRFNQWWFSTDSRITLPHSHTEEA